ncbi:hypothetical protein [Nocardioides sp. SR21]|uniref:hypothetical protein n=1 Tax=Nocardioides sp. SR21 TaxID=2919501 RepID=UPI001FA9EF17|nr:hypothetical protein [Nocardioides sp. SR21]
MTERLTMLFHEEASTIDVPVPPADAVLSRGQGLRRKRRTVTAVVGAVAAVVLVGTTLTVAATLRGDSQLEPADLPQEAAYQQLGAWARGDEVHVGNHVAVVPGIRSLQYTSLGALVISSTDDAAAFSGATLVSPDGTTHELPYPGIAVDAAASPESSYVAYADVVDADTWRLSIVDLASGGLVYTSDPMHLGKFDSADIVALTGDLVTFYKNHEVTSMDVRSGDLVPLPDQGLFGQSGLADGSFVTSDEAGWQVRSRDDGAVLLSVPYGLGGRYDQSSISPDGAWLSVSTTDGMRVYEVATGDFVDLPGDRDVEDYGWTPDGHLLGKRYPNAASEVEVCDPATGTCTGLGQEVTSEILLVRAPGTGAAL